MCRPQDGHVRRRCFSSSAFFARPEKVIVQPIAIARAAKTMICGSSIIRRRPFQSRTPSRMWVRSKVQLATSSIGYVCVELGGGEVGVTEHLLDAAQVGAALEQVRRERVAEQMRVHAVRVEPGFLGQAAEDQERPGTGQRAAARVQEEL